MSSRAFALAVAALALGCDDCPPDLHVIRGVRVLGATFDPPVAAPNGSVTVRAVTADVEERDVTVAWYRCPAPLVFTPVAALDGGVNPAAQVAPCLAQGAFAQGVSARVPIDAAGGARDSFAWRTARRWTDLVGFACAGGGIEAPPAGGVWPRCTGARGVVFTASIPGPRDDGATSPPPPATITDLTLSGQPWGEGSAPVVGRCEGSRGSCRAVVINLRVADTDLLREATGFSNNTLEPATDRHAFVSYHVTAAAPADSEECVSVDTGAGLRGGVDTTSLAWVPPAEAGEVTFWFTARRYAGGLSVARRAVRVE